MIFLKSTIEIQTDSHYIKSKLIHTVRYWLTLFTLWWWQISHFRYMMRSSLFTDWAAKFEFCDKASLATDNLWALSMQSVYSALIW